MKKGKENKNNVLSKLNREVKSKYKNTKMHPNAISKHIVDLTADMNPSKSLKSAIETKNLDEFIQLANLANKKYEVLNEQIVVQTLNTNNNSEIGQNQFSQIFLNNALKNSAIKLHHTKPLKIPKRPLWTKGIPAKEYERMERESFLNWRRAIADEEEKNMSYAITPFEKNIEVWRQLWHVVEKCDLLIQIVDGRNPLYFRCPDLETYIKEVNPKKECLILVNKADLLPEDVRKSWADYFNEKGIRYIFFSALLEGNKITEEIEKNLKKNVNSDDEEEFKEEEEEKKNQFENFKNLIKEDAVENDENMDEEITNENNEKKLEEKVEDTKSEELNSYDNREVDTIATNIVSDTNQQKKEKLADEMVDRTSYQKIKILNRDQLIELIKSLSKQSPSHLSTSYIGFVGYPNVGKSSVINVLMKKKKVAVAQMPGKTKHYQTLFLPEGNKDICLMDCPGLVFPSFTSSKADMVVNGILQIDTLREYHQPISIVIQHIPKKVMEQFYKFELPDIYSATQFLQILSQKRGFITGRSLPDEAKMAKLVLKDFVSGKLIHCVLRPDYNKEIHGKVVTYDLDEDMNEEDNERHALLKEIPADFDDDFEKINIDVDTTRQLKTNVDNFDKIYFEHMMDQENNTIDPKTQRITKDMKRALKFSLKRGEITEDEYENAVTFEDYQNILMKIQKNMELSKKNLVGVKVISLDK